MKVSELFSKKPFPSFIKEHALWKDIKNVKKIFPSLGLSNFSQQIPNNIDKNLLYSCNTAIDLVAQIGYILNSFRLNKAERILKDQLINTPEKFIVFKDKIELSLHCDIIYNKQILFHKGEKLIRVFNKLRDKYNSTHPSIETFSFFKEFSISNININNIKIAFSSNNVKGAWDIATMSERGIRSCQSWDGDFSSCLIGSIANPFVGIIYLHSSEKLKYGRKMISRALVRYVKSKNSSKEYLLIDLIYPHTAHGANHENTRFKLFSSVLQSKLNRKIDILYAPEMSRKKIQDLYIPETKETLAILHNDDVEQYSSAFDDYDLIENTSIRSYEDTRLPHAIERLNKQNSVDDIIFNGIKKSNRIKEKDINIVSTDIKEYLLNIDRISSKYITNNKKHFRNDICDARFEFDYDFSYSKKDWDKMITCIISEAKKEKQNLKQNIKSETLPLS